MRTHMRGALTLAAMATALVILPAAAEDPERSPDPDGNLPAADNVAPKETVAEPARKNVKLPGLVVDFHRRCIDLEATVCLDEGMLEFIACTKGTKEHESIVVVRARPMHVHTALLLLGARAGHPAMRRAIDEAGTRWVDVPPRGDAVDVYLVFENSEGKRIEHPIGDFVTRAGEDREFPAGATGGNAQQADKGDTFPKTFLFAGSVLVGDGPGPRTYVADRSGSVISIATFGDELLCLPGVHGMANDSLIWEVDGTKLPKVGSKVTLRLRLQRKPDAKAGKADPPPGKTTPQAANPSE